ncbi:MAG TPA: hypothetical protein VHU81_00920, partial [Thermoanaerobaculia bacterium]|nr:hypothetical protein [Thermoanaerobaculia bacterium]
MPNRHRSGFPSGTLGACLILGLLAAPAARAQVNPPGSPDDPVAALRQEIEAVKKEYGDRLNALEKRLADLEAGRPAAETASEIPAGTPAAPATEDDELAALRAAAGEAAGETGQEGSGAAPSGTAPEAAPAAPEAAAFGSERNLNRLNPEISMTGDLVGFATNQGREDFDAREFELNVQSALDPYSFTKWTLSFSPDEGVDIEEGYVSYNGLPGGLQLTAGKFRQSFGLLNRWHLHALPQIDYPLVLQSYFGDEGLAQTGLSATWLLPRPWATANELTLELTDGENDAFGGESFRRLVGLAHLKNYWDVTPSTYAELGLSGAAGGNGLGGESRLYGTDLTFHWQPPQRAKYREITWRTELLRSERDDAL